MKVYKLKEYAGNVRMMKFMGSIFNKESQIKGRYFKFGMIRHLAFLCKQHKRYKMKQISSYCFTENESFKSILESCILKVYYFRRIWKNIIFEKISTNITDAKSKVKLMFVIGILNSLEATNLDLVYSQTKKAKRFL